MNHSTDSIPRGKTPPAWSRTDGKLLASMETPGPSLTRPRPRRPPKWNGETFNGLPLLRGILIAPTKWQARCGESYTIAIACPLCGRTHTHGWPSGPKKTTPEHRAEHCSGNSGGYYIAPELAGGEDDGM
jgi:hypothetical protein